MGSAYLQLESVRRVIPRDAKRAVRRVLGLLNIPKARLQLTFGIQPLSQVWGADRGMPIHRYYVMRFLYEFAPDIRGHCLEFQEDRYATHFGGSAITNLDILHVDDSNPSATIVADLTKGNDVPGDYFDCIVCTHVLHCVFEVAKIVDELFRILKPDGVLLVAVPQVSMNGAKNLNEFWRFTVQGLQLLLEKAFGEDKVMVRAYGNSLISAGEIRGLVTHEFTKAELNTHDPRFGVEVCARAVKPEPNR